MVKNMTSMTSTRKSLLARRAQNTKGFCPFIIVTAAAIDITSRSTEKKPEVTMEDEGPASMSMSHAIRNLYLTQAIN